MTKSARLSWFTGLIALCLLVAMVVAVAAPQEPGGAPARTAAGAGRAAAGGLMGGLVISVDAAKNLIVVQTRGKTQVNVTVTADTKLVKRSPGALADLALGQSITLGGHATAVIADEIGMSPPPVAGAAAPPAAPATQAQTLPKRPQGDRVRIAGTVTKLDPLTVTTAGGVEVLVTPSATATFNLATPATLADVQAGQRVALAGETAADGSYTASLVNLLPAAPKGAGRAGKGRGNK